MFKCLNCGSEEFEYRQVSIHLGRYCADCGKWDRWVKKPENEVTGETATDKQQNYAKLLYRQWQSSGKPMTARQAGAIIQAFKDAEDGHAVS